MGTDIHSKAFDDGTQIKLYILKEYLKEWLPVFLNRREIIWENIFIYDFFAGEGSDIEGNLGSPLITLNELKPYCKRIRSEKIDVKVVFNEDKPHHCHRVMFNYYKSLIPPDQKFYLAPFSIKKNQNIYGLIFGMHHSLGIEKFLNVGWKINDQTGDANYDIDDEKINPYQPKLFAEFDSPTKVLLFERELKAKIESEEIITNHDIYEYSFESGMLSRILMPNGLLCARAEEQKTLGENLDKMCVHICDKNLHGDVGVSTEIFGGRYFLN